MPTDNYYTAVKLLNNQCTDNWQVAFDSLSEKEQAFVKKAFNGSGRQKDTIIVTFQKEKGYLEYDEQRWKFSKKYSELLVSDKGNVFVAYKIYKENAQTIEIVVKKMKASLRVNNRMTLPFGKDSILLHNLVFDTFKKRKGNEWVYFKDEDPTNCALSNLYSSKDKSQKKKRIPIQEHQLFPYKDEIFKMRYKQEKSYTKIGKEYAVSATTIKRFIEEVEEAGLDE